MSARKIFCLSSILVTGIIVGLSFLSLHFLYLFILFGPLIIMGILDMLQKKRAVLRNYPVIGNLRYFMEFVRPEIQQYFVESNQSGMPINREMRSIVYQRAKGVLQTLPYGTQRNVYGEGYEWLLHSFYPKEVDPESLNITVGEESSAKPYRCRLFNISAMSFGSLSKNAVLALNKGAKMGGFYHNTGEGGVSPYHLKPGGDLVWQIGTGYFGCRTSSGDFDEELFKQSAALPAVKMIELKLSQGAKPSHGGILPACKVNEEVAKVRGIEPWKDVHSPAYHKAFYGAQGLLKFIQKLREISGKPTGFKFCLGNKEDFTEICSAMIELQITPDFITVDGAEGGTGAAPLEFSNSLGMPVRDGLSFVQNELTKFKLRQKMRLIAAGKVCSAFHMIQLMSLGADIINSARSMMLASGCIQALSCNTNRCPTGVTTNDPSLVIGLDPEDKGQRVYSYQKKTLVAFAELLGAMGLSDPSQIKREHIFRRVSPTQVETYDEIYGSIS